MDNLIILVGIENTANQENIYSLVFTKIQEHQQARKIAVYHIYHLYKNDQETLPTPDSPVFDKRSNKVHITDQVKMTAQVLGEVSVAEAHKLGRLGLFGYAKKLKKFDGKICFITKKQKLFKIN